MDKKIIGYASLKIMMAKHIKTCSKELKTQNRVKINFDFKRDKEKTEIDLKGKRLVIYEVLSFDDLIELTDKALRESGCRGIVYQEGYNPSIMLLGKPVKPFKMLQRLIKKYSDTYISEDYFTRQYYDDGGKVIDDKTMYLCYNEMQCRDGVDFIRRLRTSKDVLKTKFVLNSDTRENMKTMGLRLIVETPHEKQKGEITLFA